VQEAESVTPIALRYVRTSFAFLIYGILVGLHLSAALHLQRGIWGAGYVSAHTHIEMVGFLLMLLAGLALWRLPEPAPGTRASVPSTCWWALTAGVIARSSFEILTSYYAWSWLGAAVFGASCLEAVVIWVLGRHILERFRAQANT
jgi:hypothetical protein